MLFSRTGAGLGIYHLVVCSNLIFLRISQWITLPTQSSLVLYYFCANLLHSLIIWLMVSSLSPHNLHLRFYCVLFILASIWLVLTALFCAAIRRDSVSLVKFPFLSHVQVLSHELFIIIIIIIIIIIYPLEFFTSALEMSDSKFPQVSRTLLSILVVFDNAVVSPWYDLFIWRYFALPLGEILFLS